MFTKLYIANDHGGYAAKLRLLGYLDEKGVKYTDLGCDSEAIKRYPYYAARAAASVLADPGSGGVLICSTGIGMSIIANKYKGIRASLCTDGFMARMTRMHNNSNILCLGGRISGEYQIQDIIDKWLGTEFEGGRHSISLGLIAGAEEELFSGKPCSLPDTPREEEI